MSYYRYRKTRRSKGHEKALEHIREAEALSQELGGIDEDVKNYFFSLPPNQLNIILAKYEIQNGKDARKYAEETIPKWRNREVHMSGMVATRLFNLLPPLMPIEVKFQLVDSLWKHVGPSSTKTYYIGPNANLDILFQQIKQYLEEVVISYDVPNSIETRFNWLSQGDVVIKQQLLNYFRQQDKLLLSETLRTQLFVLMNHLNSDKGNLTTHISQVLNIGKHEVHIVFNGLVNGISESTPPLPKEKANWGCIIWVIIGIIFLFWQLNK